MEKATEKYVKKFYRNVKKSNIKKIFSFSFIIILFVELLELFREGFRVKEL